MELKLGRLPGKVPVGLRDLTYYQAGSLPKAPSKVAAPLISDWGVDGNDQYGDCGCCGLVHGFMAVDAIKKLHVTPPDPQQIIDYYFGYTLGQDCGVVLSDFLTHAKQFGFFTYDILGFAPVRVRDIPTLHFTVYAYGFGYTGITVTEKMLEVFRRSMNPVWTLDTTDSPEVGGHCVPIVGYDNMYLYCITWGKVVGIEYSAWHYVAEEAWAVIPGEFSKDDSRGFNLAALQADLPKLNLQELCLLF